MGLYDDRMEDLSESRRSRRPAGRRPRAYPGERPYPRKPSSAPPPFASAKAARKSMQIQSLLFKRDQWTTAKAKKWAADNGYKYGKVDVTDEYIRIRQLDPKKFQVKRTITLGRGIRAVVAREENMARTAQAPRRRTRKKSSSRKTRRSTRRRTRAAASKSSTVKARRRKPAKRRKAKKKAPARRRRRTRAAASATAAAPRRRRRRTRAAASTTAAAPRRRRRARASEPTSAAPRRRRRRSAPRRRSRARASTTARAPRRNGMTMGEMVVGGVSAGFGFVVADGIDRLLATYNPSAAEKPPKDKFTSDGAGTLANTLNVASPPSLARVGAGVGLTAVPAVASMYVGKGFLKTGLQGWALGSGIKLLSTVWNNVLMPLLVGKDTSAPALQKSYIARLYPAEVAASINRKNAGDTKDAQIPVSSAGQAGALSGTEGTEGNVGQPPDVGPFALQDSPGYPDAAEALRQQAGMSATPGNDYPTVQNVWGTGGEGDFPTATQAMAKETGRVGGAPAAAGNPGQPGVSQEPPPPWQPGPPPLPGPGPQAAPGEDPACGCMNDGDQFLGFIGDEPNEEVLFSTGAE